MAESLSSVTQVPTKEFIWNKKEFVSSGSYGEVYKVKWTKSDKIIAAKHFRGSDARVSKELENEVRMLLRVNHPNIIQLIGITKDSESKPYLVMEYADCGSLHQYIHDERYKFTSSLELENLMFQLAKGVAYLHDLEPKVIHRDLKPSNLLLTNNYQTLKICDFGTVRVLASKMTAEARGTTCYRAPEVAITQGRYTEKCDVYSFGIILWEVFSGKRPYYDMENNTDAAVSYAVTNNNERPSLKDVKQMMYRENYIGLMTKCWDTDPTVRPTMEAVQDFLSRDPKIKTRQFMDCLPMPTKELIWNAKTYISSGSYGEVYKIKWTKTDKIIAAKHFTGSDARVSKELQNEVKMLLRVNHPNIIQLIGITKDSESKTCLLMDYADCGSLHQYIHGGWKIFKEKMSFHNLMLQLAKGVTYLHDMEPKVIHRDLKPSNLLLTNNYQTLKICDFGSVRVLASKMTAEARGTTCYRAPEVAMNKVRYTEKCDVYSFGIILWEGFSEKKPYYDMENNTDAAVSYAETNKNARPSLEDVKPIMNRENYIALMTKCWDTDPTVRPTMETVHDFLSRVMDSPSAVIVNFLSLVIE